MLQAQEHITALHHVCQQLESSATGKAAETRLQKALGKLEKIQQASLVSAAEGTRLQAHTPAGAAADTPTAAETMPVEQSAGRGNAGQAPPEALGSADQQIVSQPGRHEDTVMTDAHDDLAHLASNQAEALPATSKVEEAAAHQLDPGAVIANKDKVLADRKAQKDEAKVNAQVSMPCSFCYSCHARTPTTPQPPETCLLIIS